MQRSHLLLAFFLFLFAAIVALIIVWKSQKNPLAQITDFNSCVKAGYPVLQSYPPECTLPNGKFFVQQVLPGR